MNHLLTVLIIIVYSSQVNAGIALYHRSFLICTCVVHPNAWVSRATAKLPASWARPAEQPTPSQAQNAAAVASAAPYVGQDQGRPLP